VAIQSEGFNTFLKTHNFFERLSCDWSFFSSIPHKVMQDSTAAIQSEDSTKLPIIRIKQYLFEMCTAKLYRHSTDTALSIDTRTNTKYWKVRQLTCSGYQQLQHHLLIPDRFLKRISDPICTATARTCQQDCHYCSVLQLSVATTIIIRSANLTVTFMANISVSMCELYNCALKQLLAVYPYKYCNIKTLCQLLTS